MKREKKDRVREIEKIEENVNVKELKYWEKNVRVKNEDREI